MRSLKTPGGSSKGDLIDRLLPDPDKHDPHLVCPTTYELESFLLDPARNEVLTARIAKHLDRCQQCRMKADTLNEMLATERGTASPCRKQSKRRAADVPFIADAVSIATGIEKSFAFKSLTVRSDLNIAPGFLKGSDLPSGLHPQQYLQHVLSVFAACLGAGTEMLFKADQSAFILQFSQPRWRCRLSAGTLTAFRHGTAISVDSMLFLACFPVWLGQLEGIDLSALRFPLPQAKCISKEATVSNLKVLGEFIEKLFPHSVCRLQEAFLADLTSALQDDLPGKAIIHSTDRQSPASVQWPALIYTMTHASGRILSLKEAAAILSTARRG